MSEIIIDRPVAEDHEALAALFHEDMTLLGVRSTMEDKRRMATGVLWEMERDAPELVCWVARRGPGEAPVGLILANFYWSVKFSGRCLWIEALFVSQTARRLGLGRLLVERLLDWADAHEIPGIDIEAYRGNTPASVLYRRLGFERLGRERFNIAFED